MELEEPSQIEIMVEALNNLTQSFNITRARKPKCTFTPILTRSFNPAHPGFAIRILQKREIIAVVCFMKDEIELATTILRISTMKDARNVCQLVNKAIEDPQA